MQGLLTLQHALQVMSAASELFYGAIEQHEPEGMTFGQFLRLAPGQNCSAASARDTDTAGGTAASHGAQTAVQASNADRPRHYYLAQADIAFKQAKQPSIVADCRQSSHDTSGAAAGQAVHRDSLSALAADLQPPPLLSRVASELQTHFWMSIRHDVVGTASDPATQPADWDATLPAQAHAPHVPPLGAAV